MKAKQEIEWDGSGVFCDTLFFQGIGTSQTQLLKYVGDLKIKATTGQEMWCTGCRNLKPLYVIRHPFIGLEVGDIYFNPFTSLFSYLNPFKLTSACITYGTNYYYGVRYTEPLPQHESVAYHVPNLTKINIGQELDMESHKKKYDSWVTQRVEERGAVLYGVSRGTAATFCAYAKYKYPEVKLVVLEGAIDSTQNLLSKYISLICPGIFAFRFRSGINAGLSFFKNRGYLAYDPEGPSPLKSVDEFPEGIPVVFISSKIDLIVPYKNTENIARALANKGKNQVYLLTLLHSRHPNYMFDDIKDHDDYEAFIHAVYKKYNINHDSKLAAKGELLLESCLLHPEVKEDTLDERQSFAL